MQSDARWHQSTHGAGRWVKILKYHGAQRIDTTWEFGYLEKWVNPCALWSWSVRHENQRSQKEINWNIFWEAPTLFYKKAGSETGIAGFVRQQIQHKIRSRRLNNKSTIMVAKELLVLTLLVTDSQTNASPNSDLRLAKRDTDVRGVRKRNHNQKGKKTKQRFWLHSLAFI